MGSIRTSLHEKRRVHLSAKFPKVQSGSKRWPFSVDWKDLVAGQVKHTVCRRIAGRNGMARDGGKGPPSRGARFQYGSQARRVCRGTEARHALIRRSARRTKAPIPKPQTAKLCRAVLVCSPGRCNPDQAAAGRLGTLLIVPEHRPKWPRAAVKPKVLGTDNRDTGSRMVTHTTDLRMRKSVSCISFGL